MDVTFTTNIASKYYQEVLKDLLERRMIDTDGDTRGSLSARARISHGFIVGTPTYASYEPHHVGRGMDYLTMYNPKEEAALVTLFEGPSGIVVSDVTITIDPQALRYSLQVNRGGIYDGIDIPAELYVGYTGVDEWDTPESPIVFYSAEITNDPAYESDLNLMAPAIITRDEIEEWMRYY